MIPTDKPHLVVAAQSHPGEVRSNNEDRFTVTAYRLERSPIPALLAIVADGIGGHMAGEIAAQMTIDTIDNFLAASDGRNPVAQLKAAIIEADRVVTLAADQTKERQGMGSTVAVAWVIGSRLYIASAGDSRVYLLRQGRLRQINIDHTWVQEAIDHNIIKPNQARDHPQAHVLRRNIGGRQPLQPDVRLRLKSRESDSRSRANQGFRLKQGDQILLCTDGLTDLVEDVEIQRILSEEAPEGAVESFIDLARRRGGHDNITVVILAAEDFAKALPESIRPKWISRALIGLVILVILIALGLVVSWKFNLWPWSERQLPPSVQTPSATPTIAGFPIVTELPTDFSDLTSTPVPTPTITPIPADTSTPFPLPTVASTEDTNP